MDRVHLAWALFAVYLIATCGLALRGMARTRSFSGFALGNRDMGPVLVAVTLAAATASSSTFIINPGFVYTSGLSALLHFGLAGFGGVIFGLVVLSKGFRRMGTESGALTLPHWLGARYGSPTLRTYLAIFNLVLAVSFVVLIIKGSALVMQHTLEIGYTPAVILIVLVVFSYIWMGGTYAHVYTNALQGLLMIAVAIGIFASGMHLFADGLPVFFERLSAIDPNLVRPLNPDSKLFHSAWEVFGCGFIVSVGLVCQPHILTKSLYLRRDRDVNVYLCVSALLLCLFALILCAGLYARLSLPESVPQDAVMAVYIQHAFSPTLGVLISVALLAAGMSTMDGILVGASSIAGNDLVLGSLGRRLWPRDNDAEREQFALRASRLILILMGVVAMALALDPPRFVGIFAQVTVYGLVAAVLAPMVFAIYVPATDRRDALAASLLGPLVHYVHYFYVRFYMDEALQPAATAAEGTLVAFALLSVMTVARRVLSFQARLSPG